MAQVIAVLIPTLLAFAAGIFTVLSLVEKPVWPLMLRPAAPGVPDEVARLVHSDLKRVIHLLPPTMMTTMASVLVLLLAQSWLAGFSAPTLGVLVVFVALMAGIVRVLQDRIDAVDKVPSDGEIALVRNGLGALARLHHMGLAAAAITLLTQYGLVIL